jgi:Flp pilus assembly protein TadD
MGFQGGETPPPKDFVVCYALCIKLVSSAMRNVMAIRQSLCLRCYNLSGIILMILLLGACATPASKPITIAPLLNQEKFHVEDLDFHSVSPQMETFLDHFVRKQKRTDQKVWNLVWAVTDRNVFDFYYDPSLTLTSTETFKRRAGNCLSFSSMLVAMARQSGLQAWYQEVQIPPTFSTFNNTLLISMHVNVVLKGNRDEWVVDISGRERSSSRRIRKMSDNQILAQYYNNLGADALAEEQLGKAYAYFVKAIETAPDEPYLWSNLGVVYNRNDQVENARQSYLAALQLDSNQSMAANNLYLIYEKEGNIEAVRNLKAQVDRHRRKNPYYLYYLSSLAFEDGRYDESTRMLKKAIKLNEHDYRFHYELARSLVWTGDHHAAQLSLDKAVQLAPDEPWIAGARLGDMPDLPQFQP